MKDPCLSGFLSLCLMLSASSFGQPLDDTALLDMPLEELMNLVVVRKREEKIINVPVAMTHFPEFVLHDYNIQSFADYATKTPNLSFAYGNALTAGNPSTGWSSARTIAIRGISGARTTGFYIDDIPIPGSVDVRVVDMKSIEISKGPQGSLFGESSLGGNVRLITKGPNLKQTEFKYALQAGQTEQGGQPNAGVEAIGNIMIEHGKAALRMVTHVDDTAGYLKRKYRSDPNDQNMPRITVDNQGQQRNVVGSITGLFRPTSDLDLTLRALYQRETLSGFPAAPAPLPAFKPVTSIERITNLQPEVEDTWTLPSFLLTWRGAGWTLSSSTSLFQRDTRDIEDSTEGTLQISPKTPLQGFAWPGLYKSHQISQETRIAFDASQQVSGTVGVFYSMHRTHYEISPVYDTVSTPPVLLWAQKDFNTQQDFAVFGEIYYRFMEHWTLTLGDRMYWLKQYDRQFVLGDVGETTYTADGSSDGHSPRLALAYQPSTTIMLYGSATKGFRQGNAQLDPSAFSSCQASLDAIGATAEELKRIKPDSLWSYELGGKLELPDPSLVITGSAFHIDWQNIQQQALLQSCGLFLQGNAGTGRIEGGELEVSGRLTSNLNVRMGVGFENGRITKAGNTGQSAGSRIYQTPEWTASIGGVYSKRFMETLTGLFSTDYSYIGNSISSNNGPLNLVRADYSLLNIRSGVSWGKSELALNVRNATDARPNLGDITYIGYGLFTDANRTTPIPQVATLPPRTVMLQYSESF